MKEEAKKNGEDVEEDESEVEDFEDEEIKKVAKDKYDRNHLNQKSEKLNELLPNDDLESVQKKENARKKSKEKQNSDSIKEQRRLLI